jgi:hypothetical protein
VAWKDRVRDFTPFGRPGKTNLAEYPAEVILGEGTVDGLTVRCQTVCMIHEGIIYELSFEAPKDRFNELEREFTQARLSFEILGEHTEGTKAFTDNDLIAFASKKYPYQLHAPVRQWREAPDLQSDSRFDDLKLIDRAKSGELTVSPRKGTDLGDARVRYVKRQRQLYQDKVRERPEDSIELAINGRQAYRTALVVTAQGEEFLLHTTFIKGDGLIFTVQCRAPAEKRDVYEPIFAKLVSSFEVLDKIPEPAKNEAAHAGPAPEEKPEAKEPAKAEKKEAAAMASDKPEPAAAPPAAAKTASKEPPAAAKRKSLDDLDADAMPAAKSSPKKMDEAKKEGKAKPETKDAKKVEPKKKKSLDDLD